MTRSQVRYLLGTPMVADSFNKERWDYIYYFKNGRTGHVDSRRVTVYFDGDKVARLDKPTAGPGRGAGRIGRQNQERQGLLMALVMALSVHRFGGDCCGCESPRRACLTRARRAAFGSAASAR